MYIMGRPSTKKPKNCRCCGKEFLVKPSLYHRKQYCDNICRIKFENDELSYRELRKKINKKISEAKGGVTKDKRTCEGCGVEFEVESWRKNRFCGRVCSMRYTGKNHSVSWNTGLTKESNETLDRLAFEHSERMKKRHETEDIWNKGLTKETDERVAAGVEKLTELRNSDGQWKDDWKKSLSKGQVHAWSQGKYPDKFTKPEQIVWEYLESLGFCVKSYSDKSDDDPTNVWYHQYPFFDTFVPDFASPGLKSIIEVDGCAYHAHDPDKCANLTAKYGWPKFAQDNAKKDRKKHWLYHDKGWKWANVWECEALKGDFHRLCQYLPL